MLLHRLHTAVAIGDVDCGEGGGTVERKRASELGLFLATNPIEKRTKREGVRDEGENWGNFKAHSHDCAVSVKVRYPILPFLKNLSATEIHIFKLINTTLPHRDLLYSLQLRR